MSLFRLLRQIAPLAALLALASGCAYYSFSGATIPERLNTIAIPFVEDNSISTLTTLDQQLTDLFIDRFVGQTRLRLEQNEADADAVLQATIERYTNQPTAVTGGEVASLNRVSISVAVRYLDQVTDEVLLERTFSGSEEYDPVAADVTEADAATEALEQIADDVFTAATSDW